MNRLSLFAVPILGVAVWAAPVQAQTRSAPLRLAPSVLFAAGPVLTASPFGAVPALIAAPVPGLVAPALAVIRPAAASVDAPPNARAALNALGRAPAPGAPAVAGAGFDGASVPKEVALGDPVLTDALIARSSRLWNLVPQAQRNRRQTLKRALEAADV